MMFWKNLLQTVFIIYFFTQPVLIIVKTVESALDKTRIIND